jgi:hypothetical protein
MIHTHLTLEEQERAAYISGDTRTAELLVQAQRLEELEEATDEDAEDIPAIVEAVNDAGGLKRLAEKLEELEHYKQFFEDCFEMLGARYPCPEVTSDHDKQVIFDAIRKGEGLGDE